MNVKGIFITLITIVACVVVGALVLNVLLPNVVAQGINAVEDQIFRGTGLAFDFNGDGNSGSNNATYSDNPGGSVNSGNSSAGVEGFN